MPVEASQSKKANDVPKPTTREDIVALVKGANPPIPVAEAWSFWLAHKKPQAKP